MHPSSSTRSAVGELYVQHHGWVVQLLRRKLGNHDDALDLAQDTFVRMLRTDSQPLLLEPRAYLTLSPAVCVVNIFAAKRSNALT